MWVDVESDCLDRVQEGIARNVVMSLKKAEETAQSGDWITSSEVRLKRLCVATSQLFTCLSVK